MKPRILFLPLILFVPCFAFSDDSFDSLHESFLEERHALLDEQQEIDEAYRAEEVEAREVALEEWRRKNRDRLEAVREMAKDLARRSEEREFSPEVLESHIASVREMEISENLPSAQRAFLEKRKELQLQEFVRMKEVADLSPAERDEALREWRREAADDFGELRELARTISEEQEAQEPTEEYEPPSIPGNVSEKMRAFLEARYELLADQDALDRAYSDPEERDAAIAEWRENNRGRIEDVRRLAREASQEQEL